jgi:transcriptional regulator with PAS, ATPase and Fis domain
MDHKNETLCIHLSSGTPTMAAVWLLLAKTRYPAKLYQTYENEAREEAVPFDIQLDFLPELLKEPDRALHRLATALPSEVEGFEQLVGQSRNLLAAVGRAKRAAIREVNVLLLGESGTGKEMFARAMHRASLRGKNDRDYKRFIAVNCAAIPRELLEGELFGVAKGAATQTEERPGAFELAHEGTLFLDEVGECSLDHQAKLLRALQPRPGDSPCVRWIRRVGGKEEKPFNVRVIAATNRNLLETMAQGGFRDDLYYRLATVTIDLPALRERKPDIPLLANDILARINRDFAATEPGYKPRTLTAAAMRRLREHPWPGNIRELYNVLVQAAVMSDENEIARRDIEASLAQMPAGSATGPFSRHRGEHFNLKQRLREIEAVFIADALEDADNNQTRAAKLLGITQQALSKKLSSPRRNSG